MWKEGRAQSPARLELQRAIISTCGSCYAGKRRRGCWEPVGRLFYRPSQRITSLVRLTHTSCTGAEKCGAVDIRYVYSDATGTAPPYTCLHRCTKGNRTKQLCVRLLLSKRCIRALFSNFLGEQCRCKSSAILVTSFTNEVVTDQWTSFE